MLVWSIWALDTKRWSGPGWVPAASAAVRADEAVDGGSCSAPVQAFSARVPVISVHQNQECIVTKIHTAGNTFGKHDLVTPDHPQIGNAEISWRNFSLFSWYEDSHIQQTLANQVIIHFYKIRNSIRSVDYLQEPGCDFWKGNVFLFFFNCPNTNKWIGRAKSSEIALKLGITELD